jgi:hypothetical protein
MLLNNTSISRSLPNTQRPYYNTKTRNLVKRHIQLCIDEMKNMKGFSTVRIIADVDPI